MTKERSFLEKMREKNLVLRNIPTNEEWQNTVTKEQIERANEREHRNDLDPHPKDHSDAILPSNKLSPRSPSR